MFSLPLGIAVPSLLNLEPLAFASAFAALSNQPPQGKNYFFISDPQELPKAICGLANADGGDVILPATVDDADIKSALVEVAPSPEVQQGMRVTLEGTQVLILNVRPLPAILQPAHLRGVMRQHGSYLATAAGTRVMTVREQQVVDYLNCDSSGEDALVDTASIEDLDPYLAERLVAHTRASSVADALAQLGVLREGKLTVAAVVALSEHPERFLPRAYVSVVHQPSGTSKVVTGSIEEISLRVGALLPRWPRLAVVEAVRNALLHRSYRPAALDQPVTVVESDSRLSIETPGRLHPLMSLAQLTEAARPVLAVHDHPEEEVLPRGTKMRTRGQWQQLARWCGKDEAPATGASHTRNPRLLALAELLGLSATGMGLATIASSLDASGFPLPRFEQTTDHVNVYFDYRCAQVTPVEGSVLEKVMQAVLLTDEVIVPNRIVSATGASRVSVVKALRELCEAGYLVQLPVKGGQKLRYQLALPEIQHQ